jgi:hypothetical protein
MHGKDIFTFKREWNTSTGPGGSGKHKSCDIPALLGMFTQRSSMQGHIRIQERMKYIHWSWRQW